jgi:transaldolase
MWRGLPRPSRSTRCPRAPDGGDCEVDLAAFAKAGIDIDVLAKRLQEEGAASFNESWNDLMACIESKSAIIRKAS